MGQDPSDTGVSTGSNDPVQQVSWYHAIAFSNKLSIAEGYTPVYSVTGISDWENLAFSSIPTESDSNWDSASADWTADGYRLPTEIEWMWAAMGAPVSGQGGSTNTIDYQKAFAGSTGSNLIGDYAVTDENAGGTTSPVGSKLPNEIGIFDLSGNVWEWCWDWYAAMPGGVLTDYRGSGSIGTRLLRGGSWVYDSSNAGVAFRSIGTPETSTDSGIGFRVVRY
jgi:formylglycine-generating enzyme required for sulfatase activity